MPYYTDPNGFGSWWVNEGETPEQAYARLTQQQPAVAQFNPATVQAPIFNPQGGAPPMTPLSNGMRMPDYANNPEFQRLSQPPPVQPQMNAVEGLDERINPVDPTNPPPVTGGENPNNTGGPFQPTTPEQYAAMQQMFNPMLNAGNSPRPPETPPPTTLPPGVVGGQGTTSGPFVPPSNNTPPGPATPVPPPNLPPGVLGGGTITPPPPVTGAPPNVPPPNVPPPTTGGPTRQPPSGGGLDENGLIQPTLVNGEQVSPYILPDINLPQAAQMNPYQSPEFHNSQIDFMNNLANQVHGQYDYATPQIDQSGVPQPGAQQFNPSPELGQLLSGQGLPPGVLQQMRARASDSVSNAGRQELSQTRRQLEMSGLGGSPAGAAVAGDVARRSGMAETGALRDIDIANAELGNSNRLAGVGFQTQIGLSNMQQANAMALENANRMFSAMSQNVAAQQVQRGRQADVTSGIFGQQGSQIQDSQQQQYRTASQFNPQQTNTRDFNQGQFQRQRDLAQFGGAEQRWQTAAGVMPSWSPIPNSQFQPYSGYNPLNSQEF